MDRQRHIGDITERTKGVLMVEVAQCATNSAEGLPGTKPNVPTNDPESSDVLAQTKHQDQNEKEPNGYLHLFSERSAIS